MTEPAAPLDPRSRAWAIGTAALCLLPLLPQLPTLLAVAIPATLAGVSAVSWRRPMPSLLRALLAITVVGVVLSAMRFSIGRDTGCALLAAMLAIKPSETTTLRDARSLVGFALFAPFATFLLDQGPLTLLLGLVAALAALLTLQALADREAGVERAQDRLGPRMAGIGKLVALGLPLAMAAFWLFPRLGSPLWGVPERALARPGLSDSMRPGEWLDLMSDDTPALRVRFLTAPPPRDALYWRGPVFWDFDGRTWSRSAWNEGLDDGPPPATARWRYELEMEPTESRLMVALDSPLSAPAGSRRSGDGSLYALQPLNRVSRWPLQSAPRVPDTRPLPTHVRRVALRLPPGFNPRTVALARQWRREAGTDDARIVALMLDWVRRDFGYTLQTPLAGRHAVDEFLFDTRRGFCEHFSSAFVFTMRAAGVPARVVTGYAGGYRNPMGDYWLVRRNDAHAWAEVWLAGRGWVRVDPTAAVAPERIFDTLDDRAGTETGLFGDGAARWGDMADLMRRGWNDFVLGFDASRQRDMFRRLGGGPVEPGTLAVLFAVLAGGALGLMVAWSMRGTRERDPVLRAWQALAARYARRGLGPAPHEPPLAWAERLSRERPLAARGLRQVTQRFSDWRYAAAPPHSGRADQRALIRLLRTHRPT